MCTEWASNLPRIAIDCLGSKYLAPTGHSCNIVTLWVSCALLLLVLYKRRNWIPKDQVGVCVSEPASFCYLLRQRQRQVDVVESSANDEQPWKRAIYKLRAKLSWRQRKGQLLEGQDTRATVLPRKRRKRKSLKIALAWVTRTRVLWPRFFTFFFFFFSSLSQSQTQGEWNTHADSSSCSAST